MVPGVVAQERRINVLPQYLARFFATDFVGLKPARVGYCLPRARR